MDIFGCISNILSHVGQKSNNIVVGYCFNLFNTLQTEISFVLNILQSIVRHNPQLVHCFASQNFNLQHGTEFVFQGPNVAHFRMSIAINHFLYASQAFLFMKKHLRAISSASDYSSQFDTL